MNEEQKQQQQDQQSPKVVQKQQDYSLETGIGAVAGSIAGAVAGNKLIGGKTGTLVGAIAGALVGGTTATVVAEDLEALETKAMETLGEAPEENEILAHYSWEELQTLSKPQN